MPARDSGSTVPGQIIAGVVSAVVVAIGGYLLSLASNGWLIRQLGGTTPADVRQIVQDNLPPRGLTRTEIEDLVRNSVSTQLRDIKLKTFMGDTVLAASQNRNDKTANWQAIGDCKDGSTMVNFYCQIESGSGVLQNLGIKDNRFHCLWSGVGDHPLTAWGRAVCLQVVSN
jgi:hypothetical protein